MADPTHRFEPTPIGPDGSPLILASRYTDGVAVLTVENREKWYGLVLAIAVRGVWHVEKVEFPDEGDYRTLGSPYVDHVPNPAHVAVWARKQGYHLDVRALEVMLGRWCLGAANGEVPSTLGTIIREVAW